LSTIIALLLKNKSAACFYQEISTSVKQIETGAFDRTPGDTYF